MRVNIYDNLHFEDKNKITENYLSMIEWDTPRTKKTLKGLMEKRFKKLLSKNAVEVIKWEDIFDETKEMTGHQTKYQHLIDRTYLRPRDIIKFCNLVLSQYKNRMKSEKGKVPNTKFDNIDIYQAKSEYSDYFLRELDDEIHKHISQYKDYLEIFKAIGVLQFGKDDYLAEFENKKISFPSISNPINILKELFNFSVIGFYKAGGKGYGGSEYVFKYENPGAQFDESAQNFKLHPGLMDVLGLKKYSRT